MGCSCRGGAATSTQPAVQGYNFQPPKVNGVLPPKEGPFQTVLEARTRQRFYGGGTILAIRKKTPSA